MSTQQISLATQPFASMPIQSDAFNTRVETRIPLQFEVSLKRPVNSDKFEKRLKTVNGSRFGLAVISDCKLEVGAELQISAFNNRFNGTAKVCHVQRCPNSKNFVIGLSLIAKRGSWVIL